MSREVKCITVLQLQKDFGEDKQQAVARAMSNVQREVERARRQAEERCKEQYMEEMKKLAQKHKTEISAAKKKQWVRYLVVLFLLYPVYEVLLSQSCPTVLRVMSVFKNHSHSKFIFLWTTSCRHPVRK